MDQLERQREQSSRGRRRAADETKATRGIGTGEHGERWLRLLRDVALIANESDSLEGGLVAALGRVCENNGWHTGYCLVPGHPRELVWREPGEVSRRRPAEPQLLQAARGWALQVMESGRTEFVDDFATEPAADLPPPESPDLAGAIATPLLVGERVVGAMVFLSRHPLSRRLGTDLLAEHVGVIDSIGTQMGRAVERWHLLRRIAVEAEKEREALGREIHDKLSQQLVGVRLLVDNLRRRLGELTPEQDERWELLREQLANAQRQVRAVARGLSSTAEDSDGDSLIEQLGGLAEVVTAGYDVPCDLEVNGAPQVPEMLARAQLVRIAREAVFNALRHAGPSRIRIRLAPDGRGRVILEVRDDGSGLPEASELARGMGIASMRYRAGLVGARLELASPPAGGTVVRCTLDVDAGPRGDGTDASADEPGKEPR